jgi:putative ABC transport system ATP-binding protein
MKVEIRDLKKKFGQQIIFDKFNMVIESGEMVCILGKSGSGKTTLLNILGLIEKKDAGEILYDGEVITSGRKQRQLLNRNIGFIFQNFGLIDNESVYDNLCLLKQLEYKNKKNKREAIVSSLEKVGLDENILNKKVYECSGGEQQRIAIAKILLKDCNIIFADEPTASLDNENKINILQHLKELNRLGKTIVIVSHDYEVCNYCDRVISI